MTDVDIRALQQHASRLVAEAAAGKTITITDQGRPVAQLTPIPRSPLQRLRESGRIRPARRRLRDLPPPKPGPSLSDELRKMRGSARQ